MAFITIINYDNISTVLGMPYIYIYIYIHTKSVYWQLLLNMITLSRNQKSLILMTIVKIYRDSRVI